MFLHLQLFNDVYMEDPQFVSDVAHTLISSQEAQGGSNRSSKEKQTIMVSVLTRVLEVKKRNWLSVLWSPCV